MDCCPPTTSPLALNGSELTTEEAEESFAAMAKALGHPVRVRIMRVLLERAGCVCGDLVEVLPVAQSTVSQHLKVLKKAGLIQGEVDGPRVCYCVDRGQVALFQSMIPHLFP